MLVESNELFKLLIESAPYPIWIRKGVIIEYINKSGIKFLGGEILKDIAGTSNVDYIHPEHRKELLHRMGQADRGERQDTVELKYVTLKGDIVEAEVKAEPLMIEGERYVLVIANDITKRKQAERQLAQSQQRYKEMADLLPQPIFETDNYGNITFSNKAGFEYFGYDPEDILRGKSVLEMLVPEDTDRALKNFQNILSGGVVFGEEYLGKKKDGTTIPLMIFSSKIVQHERPVGIRGIAVDLTKIKEAEMHLLKAKEKAEEANQLKTAFLSNISHEIRTPLNAIMGVNSILREYFYNEADEEVKMMFNAMDEAGKRLINTITQILDIATIESKSFNVRIHEVDVRGLILQVIEMFRREGVERRILVDMEDAGGDIKCAADDYCLKTALKNIIDNAIKYSNKGDVFVRAYKEANSVIISVKDEGIGMSEVFKERLFEPFSQEELGYRRSFEGTGLGLAITKKFIGLLNGEVNIRSIKGVGTVVNIRVPLF